jgi:hypothetical protein
VKVSLIGILRKVNHIGGEGTGWQLAITVGPKDKSIWDDPIDVEPANDAVRAAMERADGRQVLLSGELTSRDWTERGTRQLVTVDSIAPDVQICGPFEGRQ